MATVTLADRHEPYLPSGTYRVDVSQKFEVNGNSLNITSGQIFFKVESEKYSVNPLLIDSIYPPAAAIGDFSTTLPHIILKRSTIPWENAVCDRPLIQVLPAGTLETYKIPWLALVIIAEGDDVTVTPFSKASWESKDPVQNFKIVAKNENDKQELITLMVSKPDFLQTILPKATELQYLSHVRKNESEENAVVICNRLPQEDKKNIVHVVSLENCFNDDGTFNLKKDKEGNVALVSLKSWEFFCNDNFIISEESLELYRNKKVETMPTSVQALELIKGKQYFDTTSLLNDLADQCKAEGIDAGFLANREEIEYIYKCFRVGHLPDILKHLNCSISTSENDNYWREGYAKLPYVLKNGKRIEACYCGPLAGSANTIKDETPLLHSDDAFQFIKSGQRLDLSYAAAWELGKLIALSNKNFSTALYKWKKSCYKAIRIKDDLAKSSYTPPAIVSLWVSESVNELKNIPFNYLIPDPIAIPMESIRFFTIDNNWLKYFIDGAFSIGRISKAELEFDKKLYEQFSFLKPKDNTRSGFILHSLAVGGWPDLSIYNVSNLQVTAPNFNRKLSTNLLLTIFDSEVDKLCIFHKPESLHFGTKENQPFNSIEAMLGEKFPAIAGAGSVAAFSKELVAKTQIVLFDVGKGSMIKDDDLEKVFKPATYIPPPPRIGDNPLHRGNDM